MKYYTLILLCYSCTAIFGQSEKINFPAYIDCNRLTKFYHDYESNITVDQYVNDSNYVEFHKLVELSNYIDMQYKKHDTYERNLLKWLTISKLGINNFVLFNDEALEVYCASGEAIHLGDYIPHEGKEFFSLKLVFNNLDTIQQDYFSVCYFNQNEKEIKFDEQPQFNDLNVCSEIISKVINIQENKIQISSCIDILRIQQIQPCRSLQTYEFIDTTTKNKLVAAFKESFEGLSLRKQLNDLLRFCQSINYKTDEELYKREVFFPPDITLIAPYSDCEDRAILFANLVEAIFPKEFNIALIAFESHVMVGIEPTEKLRKNKFDYTFRHEVKNFIAFEPTGRGHRVGVVAEYLKSQIPTFYFYDTSRQ